MAILGILPSKSFYLSILMIYVKFIVLLSLCWLIGTDLLAYLLNRFLIYLL